MRTRVAGATAVQAAVRASMTRPATITLCYGLGGPKVDRSIAGLRAPGDRDGRINVAARHWRGQDTRFPTCAKQSWPGVGRHPAGRCAIRLTRDRRLSSRHRSRPETCSAPAGLRSPTHLRCVSSFLKRLGATAAVHKSHRLLRVPPIRLLPLPESQERVDAARGCPCQSSGVGNRAKPGGRSEVFFE